MKYRVRAMRLEDVHQVSEIEREVFPTQWPFTVYKRELQNKLAHYLVAVEEADPAQAAAGTAKPRGESAPAQAESGVWARVKRFFGRKGVTEVKVETIPNDHVVGAVGFWLMLDEAHITTIGVRQSYQRQGVGELMLIKSLELAQELGARVATLEVRATNTGAQALYDKYGFKRVGLRRRYYSDNGEDALIMTTDPITSAPYQAKFQELKESFTRKRGLAS